jgi:tetratricopeptide (TPR) repeat protein
VAEAPADEKARQALARARLARDEDRGRRKLEAERLYKLGILLYSQGRAAEALAQWRETLRLDPEHGFAHRAAAHVESDLRQESGQ